MTGNIPVVTHASRIALAKSAPIIKLAGPVPEEGIQIDRRLDGFEDRPVEDYSSDDPEFVEEVEIERPKVGDKIVFLASGLLWQKAEGSRLTSEVSRAGDTHTLTRADLENTDRDGYCFWDLLHNERAQVERWGMVKFAPADPGVEIPKDWRDPRWVPESDADADEARTAAREVAMTFAEPERGERLREISRRFGMESKSTTHTTYREA